MWMWWLLLLAVLVPSQSWGFWCGIGLSLEVVDFGTVPIGQLREERLWIEHTGREPVEVLSVQLLQPPWASFGVEFSAPQTLAPGSRTPVRVFVRPLHNIHQEALVLFRLRCSAAEWTQTCHLRAFGVDSDTVYASTNGLWGEPLRQRLREMLQSQLVLPYDSARRAIFFTIDNRSGTVECVYTGRTIRVPPLPQPTVFNVEHTWPRSRGADTLPPVSDLHHLFPTLAEANERRSNLPFGIVRRVLWQLGGSRYGFDSAGAEVFEPRDAHKGDAARALFAIAVRYGNMTGMLTAAYEALLRQWHNQDTVDAWERERTRRIAAIQGRANPFVERPQLVGRLYRIGGGADFPPVPQPVLSDTLVEYRQEALQWSYRVAILNRGWAPAQLRAVDFLGIPEGVVIEQVVVDSIVEPLRVGWLQFSLRAERRTVGEFRVRLRFAAGVRPLELRVLWSEPSSVPMSPAATVLVGDELLLRCTLQQVGTASGRLLLYTLQGRAVDLSSFLTTLPDGVLQARLPRSVVPRGVALVCFVVGQHRECRWVLNPAP
ncbi:MAG: endonuclease [Candidatus Kapabacteria bacterium]|nr:endonuclease [Candidatus Kapabacteria bacterium]MDW8012289.1 endonuclease [Bacteroidota bacterium]